jgi:hypothetical protein
MPEPYTPDPPPGTLDEQRCFLVDWPLEGDTHITGLDPRPGARPVVHHLVVAAVDADTIGDVRALDEADPGPGFDCSEGLGELTTRVVPIGGSLVGGDYPRGIGTPVRGGSGVVLQVHYSLATSDPIPDLTEIDVRLEDEARDAGGIVLANAAWLVGDGMRVPAGSEDLAFTYQTRPLLFTGGQPVDLEGITPHMHRHASRVRVMVVHADGSVECLLEIPEWSFGWEQPFWLAEPVRFEPEDSLYLECRFDNWSEQDFAWGNYDQDMCAAFLTFTRPS